MLAIVLSALLLTHSGSLLTLKIIHKIEPRLSVELEQGSVFNSPQFSNIRWQDQLISISIDSMSYLFDWSCLANTVCLKKLTIENSQVEIKTESAIAEKKVTIDKSEQFKFPITVLFDAIELKKFQLSYKDVTVNLASLHLQGEAKDNNITLSSIIDGITIQLPISKAKIAEQQQAIPALLSKQVLANIDLPLNLNITSLSVTDAVIKQNEQAVAVFNSLNTQLNFVGSTLAIQSLAMDLPEMDLQLAGKIDFDAHYPVDMQVNGQVKVFKQLQPANLLAGQRIQLNLSGDLQKLRTDLRLSEKMSMHLNGQFDLMTTNIPYSLTLDWRNLHWPLTGIAQISSETGRLKSSGTLNNYRVELESRYRGKKIPAGEMNLYGTGNLQQFALDKLIVGTLNGTANLQGHLKWQDSLTWNGDLTIKNINLAELQSQYSGHFSGVIKQQFTLQHNRIPNWQFKLPVIDINGQFLKRPFTIKGMLAADDKNGISFQDVIVNNAQNRFTINGKLAQQNNLTVKINVENLGHLFIDSAGSITGELTVSGAKDALNIKSTVQGKQLRYQSSLLDKFELSADASLAVQPTVSFQLKAKKLTVENQLIDDFSVNISKANTADPVNEHQIVLTLDSELVATKLIIQMIQKNNRWQSELRNATINIAKQQLTLMKSLKILAENEQISIAPHCWRFSKDKVQQAGKLCVNNLMLGKDGIAELEIDSYQLANLDRYFPEKLKMAGSLSANALIHWTESKPVLIHVNASSGDMLVKIKNHENTSMTVPVENFNFKLNSNDASSELSLNLNGKHLIQSKIDLRMFPEKNRYYTKGNIDIKLDDLVPLAFFIPELEKITGAATAHLSVNGPLIKPQLNGQITITDSALQVTGLPLQIERLNSAIVFDNSRAIVDGSFYTPEFAKTNKTLITDAVTLLDKSINKVRRVIINDTPAEAAFASSETEPGKGTITGILDWHDTLQGEIHFFANRLNLYDYDKIDLQMSPDLHFAISNKLNITGTILVDNGKIIVKKLPDDAVSTSKDITVVDMTSTKKQESMPIEMNLQVDLGQQLQLLAMGLDTTIKGALLLRKAPAKSLKVNGELSLVGGSYRSFGQQLVLQKSRIIFQGMPESPHISIEAIRDPTKIEDDVVAGVRVSGIAGQLSLVVFSEPAMAQQDALSYILRGKSLQSSAESDGNSNSQIAGLLINLSTEQSADVINDIGNTVGIKDLSLSASGSGEEQSVGLSGYVAPGVKLSYGVGIFDSFSILAIRYEMFERFYIEASSGIEQAIDAYYQFDWE